NAGRWTMGYLSYGHVADNYARGGIRPSVCVGHVFRRGCGCSVPTESGIRNIANHDVQRSRSGHRSDGSGRFDADRLRDISNNPQPGDQEDMEQTMMPREKVSPQSRSGHSISIQGVCKRYSRKSDFAVHDVTLDIEPGEFMTFLGPSGSGKTTMLSLIAGLTNVDAGSIVIEGRDVSRLKSHRRDLGVVFQQYALFPHMTVEQNVAYPLRRRKMKGAELDRAVENILEVVQLAELSHRYPRELSGGQQQRVALARAVVYEPKALLLDEPLSA